MGKYDIGTELTNECKLTIYDLAQEIADEIEKEILDTIDGNNFNNENDEKIEYELPDPDRIVQTLKDSKGSGLVNKLKTHLHFDVENIASSSVEEKFQMLKLLKELYWIEKYSPPEFVNKAKSSAHKKIKITDILAKPKMSNVFTYYSEEYSVYGSVFNELIADLRAEVDDADKRKKIIDNIEMYWQTLSAIQYDYVLSDMAIDDPYMALDELKRINTSLDVLLEQISSEGVNHDIPSEGIMKTFYNILLTNERLCYEADRIRLADFNDVDIDPSKEYIDLFMRYQDIPLPISSISSLKDYLKSDYKLKEIDDIFKLFSYLQDITDEDIKNYKCAFDNFEKVLSMIEKEKEGMDFSSNVQIGILVPVIQEIVYIKKHSNLKIRSDHFRYNAESNSLLSALKKRDDELKPELVDVWVNRVDTRFSCNLGHRDLIFEKNKAEVKIFKIKEYIFGIHNMKYLKAAHDYLFHQAAIVHTNSSIVAEDKQYFFNTLNNILDSNDMYLEEVVFPNDFNNMDDMFRELLSDYSTTVEETRALSDKIKEIAAQVANTIIEANSNSESFTEELINHFYINKRDGSRRECTLCYSFDKNCRTFYFYSFALVYTAEEKEIFSKIGLNI